MEYLDPAITEMCQVALVEAKRSTRCPSTQDELYQLSLIQIFKVWEMYPEATDAERKKLARFAIRNRIRDYWKQNTRDVRHQRSYVVVATQHVQWEEMHTPADPDDAVAKDRLDRVVATLPEVLSKVYALKTQGMTNAQIAGAIGQSERTVRNRLSALRKALAEGLANSQEK